MTHPKQDAAREALPENWPTSGPEFNQWHTGLSKFVSILEQAGSFWCMDWQLKYLSLWTDTRDGAFLIKDRDGNKIDASRVLAAIKKWDEETGEYTKNTRALTEPAPAYDLAALINTIEGMLKEIRPNIGVLKQTSDTGYNMALDDIIEILQNIKDAKKADKQ